MIFKSCLSTRGLKLVFLSYFWKKNLRCYWKPYPRSTVSDSLCSWPAFVMESGKLTTFTDSFLNILAYFLCFYPGVCSAQRCNACNEMQNEREGQCVNLFAFAFDCEHPRDLSPGKFCKDTWIFKQKVCVSDFEFSMWKCPLNRQCKNLEFCRFSAQNRQFDWNWRKWNVTRGNNTSVRKRSISQYIKAKGLAVKAHTGWVRGHHWEPFQGHLPSGFNTCVHEVTMKEKTGLGLDDQVGLCFC